MESEAVWLIACDPFAQGHRRQEYAPSGGSKITSETGIQNVMVYFMLHDRLLDDTAVLSVAFHRYISRPHQTLQPGGRPEDSYLPILRVAAYYEASAIRRLEATGLTRYEICN